MAEWRLDTFYTGSSLAQTNRDGERRASILRLTLDGLEADLDDLRDELIDELERYEGELKDVSEQLPAWLAVQPAAVRDLFQLPSDGEGPPGVLGPRTVALAAAGVEEFINSWLANPVDDLDDDGAQEYEDSYRSTVDAIDAYETFARHAARDAQETLADWLDGILTELEDTRERDEAALRQLISEGTIEKGRDARTEIAGLWEDQRARAADVRKRWALLEEHTFRGLELTIDGLTELRSMLDRADEGVRGGYDALDERSEPQDAPETPDIDKPGGGTLAGMQHEDEGADVDTERRETVELDRSEVSLDEASKTFLRVSPDEASDASEVSDAVEDAEDDSGASDEDIDDVGDTLIDEASDTAPIDSSELAQLTEESAAEDSEPDEEPDEDADAEIDEAEPGEVETVEMDRDSFEEDMQSDDVEPEPHDEPSEPTVDDDEPEASDVSAEVRSGFEPVMTEGFRVLDRYVRVGIAEVLVVLGPPLGAFLFLVVMTAMARSGQGIDPIRDTPWGLILFGGAVIWLLLAPVIAHWQFRFDGIVPRFVRLAEVIEEADIEVDHDRLRIGRQDVMWRGTDVKAARWESPPDGTFGWCVSIERGERRWVLAAAERNITEWQRSELPIDDSIEHDAWQVDARVIDGVLDATEAVQSK